MVTGPATCRMHSSGATDTIEWVYAIKKVLDNFRVAALQQQQQQSSTPAVSIPSSPTPNPNGQSVRACGSWLHPLNKSVLTFAVFVLCVRSDECSVYSEYSASRLTERHLTRCRHAITDRCAHIPCRWWYTVRCFIARIASQWRWCNRYGWYSDVAQRR